MQYKKKSIPISKIQNLLAFICQLLILAILGTALAGPIIASAESGDANEIVIIVDASAGMRISDGDGRTRFARALEGAGKRAEDTFDKGSSVSFIVADGLIKCYTVDFAVQKGGNVEANFTIKL